MFFKDFVTYICLKIINAMRDSVTLHVNNVSSPPTEIVRDTLAPVVIYREEMKALVVRLEDIKRENIRLTASIIVLSLIFISVCYIIIRKSRKKIKLEVLAKNLLKQSAAALPAFTENVNKLSSKNIKLSTELYEDFQSAIDNVKNQQKNGISVIVNNAEFEKQYPYIKNLSVLSAQEKLVLILYEENFKTHEIALFLGIGNNAVRAVKAKVKNKLTQSGCVSGKYKKIKILK